MQISSWFCPLKLRSHNCHGIARKHNRSIHTGIEVFILFYCYWFNTLVIACVCSGNNIRDMERPSGIDEYENLCRCHRKCSPAVSVDNALNHNGSWFIMWCVIAVKYLDVEPALLCTLGINFLKGVGRVKIANFAKRL